MRMIALGLLCLVACTGSGDDGWEPTPDPTPVAQDDQVTMDEDGAFALTTLAANDMDVNYLLPEAKPLHGEIANGMYIPEHGYFGTDTFTYAGKYESYGSVTSAPATVTVTITSDGIPYEHSQSLVTGDVTDLASGDVNGDGKLDLVGIDSNDSEMKVFLNTSTGEGMFSLEAHAFEGGRTPRHVAVADLDRDGKLDVLTAADDGVTIFRNITQAGGPLAFAGPALLGTGVITGLVAIDLDGDGAVDLAATQQEAYYNGNATLHTWINQSTSGTVSFGVDTTFAIPPGPIDVTAVDVDHAGGVDLAVLSAGRLSLLVNATTVAATTAAFQARVDRDTATSPKQMFLADLDRDSAPEIGVLHSGGKLWIYENRGGSAPDFEAARVLDVTSYSSVLAPIDFSGDGSVDLIAANGGSSKQLDMLTNVSQPQSFEFQTAFADVADAQTRKLASLGTPTKLLFVDLDGVAPNEVVVSSNGSGAGVRVLYGP